MLLCGAAVFGQDKPAAKPEAEPIQLQDSASLCVDKITGTAETSEMTREAIIAVLAGARRWTILDECQAGAYRIKGSVLATATERSRGESEKTSYASGAVGATASAVGGAFTAISGQESLQSAEKGLHASVSLRLVEPSGRIVWAGTWDSPGGKSRHAVPDAAERVTKSLLRAIVKK